MTEFATQESAGITVIEATGRLDALVSPQLDESLQGLLTAGQARLVVDFGQLTYISSSCLRVLLLGVRRAREAGGDVKLCCLSSRVHQVFALAGFDLVFELWETRDQAVRAFASSPRGPNLPCSPG